MPYMKFHTSLTPNGRTVSIRVCAGASHESNDYIGTLVLPTTDWEKLLDCMIYGASHVNTGEDPLEIFFGPDERDD